MEAIGLFIEIILLAIFVKICVIHETLKEINKQLKNNKQ